MRETETAGVSAGSRHEPPRARVSIPPAGGLSRDRLLRALDRLRDGGVGVVLAPAGCGKTTLMADWARRFPGTVAWYRARPDDLPERLVDHLAVAVGIPASQHALDVDDVARALERRREPRLLVVDDVHALPDRTSHAVLEALLMEVPSGTTVLLGSRRPPDLDFAHGEMPVVPVTLGAEDLRFRSWEVESLFRDVYQAPLLPEDAAALARHTEGWAAALHLFHLSTSHTSRQARRSSIAELARRNRYARGYLSRQVLAGLGTELSGFMRRTAVFESMTAARCDALLRTEGSQALLEDLAARQALTTTDDGGLTFRYHEVLRRHLEADLESELGAAALREWYARAALLLEQDGAVVEALRVRARAQDWSGVRALLVRSGHEVAARAGSWPGLVPASLVREDPWIALAEAHRLLGDGRLSEATDLANRAIVGLDDPRGHERARELVAIARAWHRLEATPSGRWYEKVAAALHELPRGAPARNAKTASGDLLAAPFLALLQGDFSRSRSAVTHARARVDIDRAAILALDLLDAALALLGGRQDARAVAEAVAIQAELAELEWFARMAQALLASSHPDPSQGQDELQRLVALCDRRGDLWGAAWACGIDALLRARTVWNEQNPMAAAALTDRIQQAERRFRDLGAEVPATWFTSLSVVLATRSGQADVADRARHAVERARRVNCLGAEAWATWALGMAEDDATIRRVATYLADDAGLAVRPWQGSTLPAPATGRVSDRPQSASDDVQVRIVLLGGFRIERAGSVVDLAELRPQHRLLLRILALHAGGLVHRDQLVEALWPEQTSRTAQHRLQTAVSALRRLLERLDAPGPGCRIVRDGPRYGLALGPGCSVDVATLRHALATAHTARRQGDCATLVAALRSALEEYTADLLPEDGPAEWVVDERERLRADASSAASTLAAELTHVDPRAAVSAAERALAIDPYNDEAWRLVIAMHTELGDLAMAERARNSYRGMLADLGVASADHPRV